MTSSKGWFTKYEVMRDLAKVSGVRTVFDENYAVVGEQPPPHLICDDVDEEQMSFGYLKSKCYVSKEPDLVGITKMLRSVDHYNQLSQKNNLKPLEVAKVNHKENAVIVISKLNPAAAEFVPKDFAVKNENNKPKNDDIDLENNKAKIVCENDTTINEKKEEAKDIKTDMVSENNVNSVKDTKSNNKENIVEYNKAENCDANQIFSKSNIKLNQKEILERRKELRKIVSETTKTNCVKVKKERNIAIQALWKLYSKSNEESVRFPTSPSTTEPVKVIPPESIQESGKLLPKTTQELETFIPQVTSQKPLKCISLEKNCQPIKLLPPAYYESSLKDKKDKEQKHEDDTKCLNNLKEYTQNDIPIAMDLVIIDDEFKPSNAILQNKIHSANEKMSSKMSNKSLENTDDAMTTHEIDNRDIESVEKVKRWLNSVDGNYMVTESEKEKVIKTTEKPKISKAPILGPVTFKRKQTKSKSPNLSGDTSETFTNKTSASPGPSTVFVPSEYANKLRKRFAEQANAKRLINEDIWTRLENELKEKEKLMKAENASTDLDG